MNIFKSLTLLAVTAAVAIPAVASAHDGDYDRGRPVYADRSYGYGHGDYDRRERQRQEFIRREMFRREMIRREMYHHEYRPMRFDYGHDGGRDAYRHDDRRGW